MMHVPIWVLVPEQEGHRTRVEQVMNELQKTICWEDYTFCAWNDMFLESESGEVADYLEVLKLETEAFPPLAVVAEGGFILPGKDPKEMIISHPDNYVALVIAILPEQAVA